MICPHCGKTLPATTSDAAYTAAVCPFCGLALSPAATSATTYCPVCGAITAPNAQFCRHCGTPLAAQPIAANKARMSYIPPPTEQISPNTTPYAQSRYLQPPIMHTVPLVSPLPAPTMHTAGNGAHKATDAVDNAGSVSNTPAMIPVLTTAIPAVSASPSIPATAVPVLSPDETPTVLAQPEGDEAIPAAAPEDEGDWGTTPPLTTPIEPEESPFAMTAAPVTPIMPLPPVAPESWDAPATSATPARQPEQPDMSDGEPDDDELPDYETPDVERPAIHAPPAPLPDYDTPDVERAAVHPAPATNTPALGHLAPMAIAGDLGATNADDVTPANNGTTQHDRIIPDAAPLRTQTYPDAYAGPDATNLYQTPIASAPLPQASDHLIERFFGAQPVPSARIANNAVQRLWQRFLPPEWAAVPWISIPVGALVALVVGLLVTAIGLLFWSRAIGFLPYTHTTIGATIDLAQALLTPNLLQLFLLEHGVSMALTLNSSGASGSFSALETLPLSGLSLIPACALMLGGYVAAASDFSHRLRFSVLRGALVGPVYAILLLIVAVFGSSTVKLTQNTLIQLHPSVGHAFLAGLIGGTALGALGGLLAVRRHHLFTTRRSPDLLAGAAWGALIALGSGLLLALVALAAGVAAHAVGTVPAATTAQAGGGLAGALGAVIVAIALLLVVAPVAALWLFALGTGASLESWFHASGIGGASGSSTFGLLAAQHHPPSIVWYLLLLIPLASYLIGGRAAARIAHAESLRDGALVGWLMAVALSLLLVVLTLLSRILIASQSTLLGRHISTDLGIAPSAWGVFLLTLIVGGILGALGGAGAVIAPQPGPILAPLAAPLAPHLEPALALARRPWDMLDDARGQRSSRTALPVLVYAALVLAVALLALFLLVVVLGLIASHFAPISAVRGFDGFFFGLAVGAPLLLLASAAILAVVRALPPLLTRPQADVPDLPRFPRR